VNKQKEKSFEEKLDENIYFTLRGCKENGTVKVPKTIFNFVRNIAGECTDSHSGPDFYKNPRAMFVALDLIYSVLDEIEREGE